MPSRKISRDSFFPALQVLFFVAFTLVFINVAWVADDAFITFRAVDNFLKGYGPVWNVGERVQVYTHPLWYALLIVGIGLFKHHYWVTIALSYGCLMAAIYLLLKIAKNATSIAQVVIALFVLLLSRAFMDYSSSGLENPLLHLLLACYMLVAIRQQDAAKRFMHTSLLYSLVFLTRPDGIFIITPASLWMLWKAKQQIGWKHTLKLAAISASPALAWETFSLIYYGSLVPNTALAKVNIDYPRAVLLEQAKNYFIFNLQKDPITLGMVFLSFALVWLNKNVLPKLLMVGVVLQMLYICYVGADYMLGRFLSPSVAVAAVAFMLLEKTPCVLGGGMMLLFFLGQPDYNLKYSPGFLDTRISKSGMCDERAFYYRNTGLVPVVVSHGGNAYSHIWGSAYAFRRNAGTPNIAMVRASGFGPWLAGEKPYWIDMFALGEPYLARLPARTGQRVGHYHRAFPEGYMETIVTGKNSLSDAFLAALYDDVALAARGDIWSLVRWGAIWRLNSGHYKNLAGHFDRDSRTPWRAIIHPAWHYPENWNFDARMGNAFEGEAIGLGFPLAVPPAFSSFSQER